MLVQKKLFIRGFQRVAPYIIGLLFIGAVVLRVALFHVQTSDYTFFLSNWYSFIQSHNGFAAFKYSFSNYNVPYLYLLALLTYTPVPKLLAIKSLSVLFDALLGLFTYLIISLKFPRSYAAIIGVLVVLYAPTIFINSAAWGQADATYTAFCLGSLYFLLTKRPAWACVFFGLAISFKLQAIFFLPVLLILLFKKRLPAHYLALIPLVFLLLLVPAFIAGRSASSLLSIYVGQVTTGGVGGGVAGAGTGGRFNGGQFNGGTGTRPSPGGTGPGTGQFPGRGIGTGTGQFPRRGTGQFDGSGGFRGGSLSSSSSSLTLNAPSMYQWFPTGIAKAWEWLGIILGGLFVLLIGSLVIGSKREITSGIILKIALVFAVGIPFLLPEMHERYFYLADVLSILYAFYYSRRFYVPILVQCCSLFSYAPYFLSRQIIPLPYLAGVELVVVLITTIDLIIELYPDQFKRIPSPAAIHDDEVMAEAEIEDGQRV